MEECKTKLASGEVTPLDNCVLDTLGINRRQVTGDQDQLAQITQECTEKTPNDQAAIYICLLQAAQSLIITE